jgi:hypothetical protein
MKSVGLLTYSQEPAADLYPEPYEFHPYHIQFR